MTDLATRPPSGSGAGGPPRPSASPPAVGPSNTTGPLSVPLAGPLLGPPPPGDDLRTPLDRWLADQRELTAVDRFSQHHDSHDGGHLHASVWEDLIPLSAPRPGEQYRFEVDLDACTGCKACVAACHSLNGLDEGESFRTVGTLHGIDDRGGLALLQTVTSACHHCLDPACMLGCPTNAYEKDPATGVVRHLDDQCIGCSYCTLTCPYEVPKFNERLGIVRKCDLCHDRLADGEAPACVQGCPTNAIRVGIVDVADLRVALERDIAASDDPDVEIAVVPSAPPSRLTTPTTTYRRAGAPIVHAEPADRNAPRPAHAHTPLAVMLVLTQLAAGVAIAGALLPWVAPAAGTSTGSLARVLAITTASAGLLAIGASLLHLGRPLHAWKAVLGLRTSWLSREIVAFGGFAALSILWAGEAVRTDDPNRPEVVALGAVTAAVGLLGVACSALIYAVTGRRWWAARRTIPRFLLTTISLGFAAVVPVAALAARAASNPSALIQDLAVPSARIAAAAMIAKLLAEAWFSRRAHADSGQLARTARLLNHDLAQPFRLRLATGAAAAAGLVVLALAPAGEVGTRLVLGTLVLVAATVSELLERWLFFTASSPRRMPGAVP